MDRMSIMYVFHCSVFILHTECDESDSWGMLSIIGLTLKLWLYSKIFDKPWVLIVAYLYVRLPSSWIFSWLTSHTDEYVLQSIYEDKSTGPRDAALVRVSVIRRTRSLIVLVIIIYYRHQNLFFQIMEPVTYVVRFCFYLVTPWSRMVVPFIYYSSSLSRPKHALCPERRTTNSSWIQSAGVSIYRYRLSHELIFGFVKCSSRTWICASVGVCGEWIGRI
jgi:hypothetical protein